MDTGPMDSRTMLIDKWKCEGGGALQNLLANQYTGVFGNRSVKYCAQNDSGNFMEGPGLFNFPRGSILLQVGIKAPEQSPLTGIGEPLPLTS